MPLTSVNQFSVSDYATKMVISMIVAAQSFHVVGHLPINKSGSSLEQLECWNKLSFQVIYAANWFLRISNKIFNIKTYFKFVPPQKRDNIIVPYFVYPNAVFTKPFLTSLEI